MPRSGAVYCRDHTPIAELAAERENGHQQGVLGEPGGSTTREPAKGAQHILAGPGSPNTWTRETAIEAVQAFAKLHGRPPKSREQGTRNGLPAIPLSTSIGVGRNWGDLIEAAGFPRPTAGHSRPKRQARAPKAPEKRTPTPSPAASEAATSPPAVVEGVSSAGLSPEPEACTDEPGTTLALHTQETNGGGFNLHLALTGDFTHDAFQVRKAALKLRAQAEALDVIAQGIDQLAATVPNA